MNSYELIHSRSESRKAKSKVINVIDNAYSKKQSNEDNSPIWFFCGNYESSQFQAMNCILCSNYIMSNISFDPKRKLKRIYCDDLEHHNLTNKTYKRFRMKELLNLYEIKKKEKYLLHASLIAFTYNDNRLTIIYHELINFLGIKFHPY